MISVICFTGDSGLTDYSASLCRELAHLADVELVTADSFSADRYKTDFITHKIFRRTRHLPVDLFRFVAHILRTKPRWVLYQSWVKIAWLDGLIVALFRLFGIRCALTIHDILPHYPKKWSPAEVAFFFRRFDALIVHSQNQAKKLASLGVTATPLVVPHGIYDIFNIDHLTQEQARAFLPSIAPQDFVVLFFGHLEDRKGILEFLECAARLQSHSEIKFLIAGKPKPSKQVEAALDEARALPNVILHDKTIPHHEVQYYVAACDALALPYREGTTSGVLKLAMAFGKPALCTDVGDFAETLEEWPGLLLDQTNLVADLEAKILLAASDRNALSQDTSLRSKEFQWDSIAARYAKFLDEIYPIQDR